MKIKLMEPVTGPNGEKFSDEAETKYAKAGEWVLSGGRPYQETERHAGMVERIVLTPLPPATKVERIKVLPSSWKSFLADGRVIGEWPTHADFRGAVYIHPLGNEVVTAFTHPIFVRQSSLGVRGDCDFAFTMVRDKIFDTMLWPSFIEVER
jgi:hypothetical protein